MITSNSDTFGIFGLKILILKVQRPIVPLQQPNAKCYGNFNFKDL